MLPLSFKSARNDPVAKKANYRCQLCKKRNVMLQAHHLSYGNLKSVSVHHDLICVCSSCHGTLHEKIKDGNILSWEKFKKRRRKAKKKDYKFYLKRKINVFYRGFHINDSEVSLNQEIWSHLNAISDEINGTSKSITYMPQGI